MEYMAQFQQTTDKRLPSLFVAHGSPMTVLLEDDYTDALKSFSRNNPRPAAIVIASAYWNTIDEVEITANNDISIKHDFRGFPDELYSIQYDAPGSVELAQRVSWLFMLRGIGAKLNIERKIDHGVWIPLINLYPEADIPVIEISLPFAMEPREIMRLGHTLAPLREQGVLLVGSGAVVHNMKKVRWHQKYGPADSWAFQTNAWVKNKLNNAEIEELLHFEQLAPNASKAQPSPEHLLPLYFVIGSSLSGDQVEVVYDGFHYGNMSMLSFSLRPT